MDQLKDQKGLERIVGLFGGVRFVPALASGRAQLLLRLGSIRGVISYPLGFCLLDVRLLPAQGDL